MTTNSTTASSVTVTTTANQADSVKFTASWGAVKIVNQGATTLYFRCDGYTATVAGVGSTALLAGQTTFVLQRFDPGGSDALAYVSLISASALTYTVAGINLDPVTAGVVAAADLAGGYYTLAEGQALEATVADLEVRTVPSLIGSTPMAQATLVDLMTAVESGTSQIAFVGDSILELTKQGHELGTFLAARFGTNRLIAQQRHFYDDGPSGGYNAWGAGGTGGGASGVPVMAAAGYSVTLGAGQSRTYTPAEPTTSISVFYTKSLGAGTFNIKCDGVTTDTIDCNAASTTYSNLITSTSQTLGVHTWVVERATGTVVLEESFFHAGTSPTSGNTVWSFAHTGLSANEVTSGYLSNTSIVTALTNLSPTAVVICLGTNDTTPVTAGINALIDAIKAAISGVIIIVAVPYVGSTCSATDVAAIRALAVAGDYAVVDYQAALGSLADSNDPESQSSDSIHPDAAGMEAIHTATRVALGGDPLGALAADAGATSLMDRARIFQAMPGTGKVLVGDILSPTGLPALAVFKTVTDTQPEFVILGADFAALLGLKAGIMAGPGGSTIVDTYLYRDAVAAWKTNATIEAATPTANAHLATKLYVDTADGLALLKASNLSDVATPATAFTNIKQAATSSATGVVELATDAELQTGTDTTRAVTPANVEARFPARGRPKSATTTHLSIPGCVPVSVSTLALTANRCYFFPIYFDHPSTIDQLSAELTAGVGASSFRIGVATANEDYQPLAILHDSGSLSGVTPGVLTSSPSLAGLVGRHLVMWHSDAAITLRAIRAPMVDSALRTTLGANAILSTMYRSTAYGAFTTAVWDTNGYLSLGPDCCVFPRISDPTP